jgi:hypothetical protein
MELWGFCVARRSPRLVRPIPTPGNRYRNFRGADDHFPSNSSVTRAVCPPDLIPVLTLPTSSICWLGGCERSELPGMCLMSRWPPDDAVRDVCHHGEFHGGALPAVSGRRPPGREI